MKATLRAARPDDVEADDTSPEEKEAIVQAIKDARLWSTGEMIHESDIVAEIDGKIHGASRRGWGGLLARAWLGGEDDYRYTTFAWGMTPSEAAPSDVVTAEQLVVATGGKAISDEPATPTPSIEELYRTWPKPTTPLAPSVFVEAPAVVEEPSTWSHTRTVWLAPDRIHVAHTASDF